MSKHKHFWDTTEIPAHFICECGATRHYLRAQRAYCIHESEDESVFRLEKVSNAN